MSDMAHSRRRGALKLRGTAFQQATWKRIMIKEARKAAGDVVREAAHEARSLERLADRLEAEGPTRGTLLAAFNKQHRLKLYACKFLGLTRWRETTRHDFCEALYPTPNPESKKPKAPIPEASAPQRDEASIIRVEVGGSVVEIDWNRHPIDDRERRVRAEILRRIENKEAGSPVFWMFALSKLSYTAVTNGDLWNEYQRATKAQEDKDRGERQAMAREALAEVNDDAPADNAPSNDPVVQAQRIIREAMINGPLPEIDWSRNPVNDRERTLRAAMLRVIERDTIGSCSDVTRPLGPILWLQALQDLLPSTQFVGKDLYDEIQRAKALPLERKRLEREKQMRKALREIGGATKTEP